MFISYVCITLEKYLLISFGQFQIGLFVSLLLNCKCSLYILDTSLLLNIQFPNIFSHPVGCLFTLLMVYLETQNFLIKPIYMLLLLILLITSINPLPNLSSDRFTPKFSSKSCIASVLTLRSFYQF